MANNRPSRPKPDFGLFIGVAGLLFSSLLPILQMNGAEINWECSAIAYTAIIIGFVWTFLAHAVPHRGKIIKFTGSFFIIATTGALAIFATLRQYHAQHPKTPKITVSLNSLHGLPESITNDSHLRFYTLQINNDNEVEINNLRARLQLPEPVEMTVETNSSPGLSIEWKPILTKFTVFGTGNHKILGPQSSLYPEWPPTLLIPLDDSAQLTRYSDSIDKTGVWGLLIDKLPPHSGLKLSFLTTDYGDATNYISLANYEFKTNGATIAATVQGTTNGSVILHDMTIALIVNTNKVVKVNENWHLGTNELRFSLDGWYEFTAAGKLQNLHFLVPLIFDSEKRSISSLPAQDGIGKWRLVMIEYQ
jgi:hypothetical protein